MSFRSTLGTAVVALFGLCAPMVEADESKATAGPFARPPKAVQVARGNDYVICAIPHRASASLLAKSPKPAGTMPVLPFGGIGAGSPGASVLHISLRDGAVKCLLSSGDGGARLGPPQGINWTYFPQSRILGICADRQRLYVLAFAGGATVHDFTGRGKVSRPMGQRPYGVGTYHLSVFDLREGTSLVDIELKDAETPTSAPLETLGTGPMKLLDDGVTVYGKTFRFDGKTLIAK